MAYKGITSKGKAWEIANSIWMLWAILTIGFFNYISFFYISYRVKQRKWFYYGLLYSIPFIIAMFTVDNSEHWSSDFGMTLLLLSWIFSIFHAFKIRPEYLLRLEARQNLAPNQIESLRNSIKKEYGVLPATENASIKKDENRDIQTIDRKVPVKQQDRQQNMKPIDINTATEAEFAAVPGLGLIMAKKIITIRQEIGAFQSIEHFGESLGLKPHMLERVRPYLYVKSSTPKPATSPSDDSGPTGRVLDI